MRETNTSLPSTVYKYRTFENTHHLRILTANEIYFAAPSEFNDPFDCAIPFTFWNSTEENNATYISLIAKVQAEYAELDTSEQNEWINAIVRRRLTSKPSTRREQHLEELFLAQEHTERFGIFSIVSDNLETGLKGFENNLMWSHYSNHHTGFCVGFNVKRLLAPDKVRMKRPENIFFEKVEYLSEYPILSPYHEDGTIARMSDEEARLVLRTKDAIWDYEREWRWLIQILNGKSGRTTRSISPDTIESVHPGIRTSIANEERIKTILQNNQFHPELYKAYYQEGKYVLGFENISY